MRNNTLLVIMLALVASSTAFADGNVDGTSELRGNEIIIIHDRTPPRRPQEAQPLARSSAPPPYSDEAILSDAWAKAWLMLEVSDTGTVTRVKFLKRPGHELDKIAIDQAMRTKFAPARTAEGKAVVSYEVWPIEWPSHGWLAERLLDVGGWQSADLPPCTGAAPLSLDSVHPVYRDCSLPNLARADASEPWTQANQNAAAR